MFTGLIKQLDFGNDLIDEMVPRNHDLVKLKTILDWEKMDKVYSECYQSRKGNATKRSDLVLGLIILQHLYKKPYRVLIDELHINTAYMHFCSVSYDDILCLKSRNKKLIDHSTLIKIKYRLGPKRFRRITEIFLKQLIKHGFVDGKRLYSDTTSLEKNILYPTDISLLKRVIEEAEAVIQKVCFKKDMIKSEIIKKANKLAKIFYSSSKKTKELIKATCTELIKIAHDLLEKASDTVNQKSAELAKHIIDRYKKLKVIGQRIIDQTKLSISDKKVDDRIVSYFEDHSRSLPKGKAGKPVEFGDKLRIDMSDNGYVTNWELYIGNPGDVTMLEDAIEHHDKTFNEVFHAAGFDRSFYDEQKIAELEEKYKILLAIPHKKDRTRKMTEEKEKIYNKRSAIEAKISEGKRMCGLDKSLYHGFDGDLIWTAMSVFSLNIRKLLRDLKKRPQLIYRFS